MRRKGFTLLELVISIAIMLTILGAAYSMLTLGVNLNKQILMEKELIEVAEQFQKYLVKEFSYAGRIEAVLDCSGKTHYSVGADPIDIKSIKLVSSEHPRLHKPFREELIFLKDYEKDYRYSVWAVREKGMTKRLDVVLSMGTKGQYEIATLIRKIQISHIEENIYQIDLTCTYFDTNIHHSKSFFVRLQN